MLPDAVTAPIVREIFLSVIDGKSTTQIAKELNGRGVLTPLAYKQHRLKPTCQGRELMWSHITVLNILHNYKYTGAMTNHVRESRYMRDNNQRRVPREDWIITEDAHEAIVTKDEFEAANAQLRVVKKHDRRPPSSYDNVFYCGHCGRKLRKSFGQDTYFACDTRIYQEDAVCSSIRWSKTDLETVLLPVYKAQLYLLGEKAKQLSANTPATVDWNERLTKIDQEIAACDAWKIKYYEAYRDGEFDRDTFVERKAGLDAKIEMLRTHRAKLETEQRQQQQAVIEQAAASQELSKYLSATSLNDDQLKEHIYRAIESVRVFNDRRIEIQWKFKDLFAVNARTERNAV